MTDKIESARVELESICGPGHALVAADAKARYLRDWRGEVEAKAIAVARPANAAQVAAVVRFCARAGLAIVPQGGNTGMCAGATPHPQRPDCVVVALERMRAIRAIDAEERAATVEAGVVLETLQEAARAHGLLFPLDLGARASCQIGGMLATNAGGVNTIRHGCARDLCLGIEAVMADGEIVDLLSTLRKDNTGYDLKNLLIGSEGTLAIITAATLRLRTEPRARVACCVAQKDAKAAMRLLSNLQAGDAAVEAFELIPRFSAALVGEHFPDLRRPFASPPPLCSLVDFSGEDESILRTAIETALAAAIESGDATDAAISNSESQRRDFWALREAIPLARARAGKWAQIDAALPVATIADFIAAVESKFAPRCDGQIRALRPRRRRQFAHRIPPAGKIADGKSDRGGGDARRDSRRDLSSRRLFQRRTRNRTNQNGVVGAAQKSRRVARDGGDQARARSARNDESGQSPRAQIARVIATENIELLDLAARWRGEGKRVAAATVVSTWGSAPRPPGGRLVVCEDGRFAGSVSGGCIENEVIAAARETMQNGKPQLLDFGIADETAWRVGLSCGGKIQIHIAALGGDARRRFCANGKMRCARARRALF